MFKNKKIKKSSLILIITSTLVCSLPLSLIICNYALPSQYDHTFLGEMKYKHERLLNTKSKRIIVIGGSSVPFSLNSSLLKEYFPEYEIVNYGMYADLGISVMLDFVKDNIHKDDIIIISPEQSSQTLSNYFSGDNFWQCDDGYNKLFPLLSLKRKQQAIASFPSFVGKKINYSINGLPEIDGIYTRDSFNEYGDISYQRDYNIMSLHYNPNQLISFDKNIISKDFIDELNSFSLYASNKGAEIYYRFAPINKEALISNKNQIDEYYQFLHSKLHFSILGNPHNSVLSAEWFYDTNFHLNSYGATYFTKGLIQDLKILKKDSSPTNIEVNMPTFPDLPPEFENTVDSDKFDYEETDKGLIITNLNALANNQKEIIIPTSYQDKPIIDIKPSTFVNNKNLESITIYPNIGTLYDNMFSNCSFLKKLILKGKPESYTVGDHLRNNASFNIYVDKEYLNDYKLNYSFQKYSLYIYPNEE